MLGKRSKEDLEKEASELKQQLDAINAEEIRVALEKSKKAGHRKSLEHQQLTRQQMFHSMSPLPVRIMFFYAWLSKNIGLVNQKEIDTYIVNAKLKTYFDSLKDVDGPEKPLKFDSEDNLVSSD